MTLAEFTALFRKGVVKSVLVGGFIALFGIFIVIMMFADLGMEDMTTAGIVILWILAALCILVGIVAIYKPIKNNKQIDNGTHPLINAIINKDQEFVQWYYEYIVEVSAGPAKNNAYQMWIICKNKKQFILSIKKNQAPEIMEFLANHFPNAIAGYSKENEQAYKKIKV